MEGKKTSQKMGRPNRVCVCGPGLGGGGCVAKELLKSESSHYTLNRGQGSISASVSWYCTVTASKLLTYLNLRLYTSKMLGTSL